MILYIINFIYIKTIEDIILKKHYIFFQTLMKIIYYHKFHLIPYLKDKTKLKCFI